MIDRKKLQDGYNYQYFNEDSYLGLDCFFSNSIGRYVIVFNGETKTFKKMESLVRAIEYYVEKYNLSGGILEKY